MMTHEETQYVTIEEAADLLKEEMEANGWRGGVHTIHSWVSRGVLTKYRRGRRIVLSLTDLRAYIRLHGLQGEVRPWDE